MLLAEIVINPAWRSIQLQRKLAASLRRRPVNRIIRTIPPKVLPIVIAAFHTLTISAGVSALPASSVSAISSRGGFGRR